MTGADAPALRALAGQMSQSAVQLDRMRQTIRARVYSINWQGLDGANFRRAWDTQHGPMLTRVAEGLRATAQNLLREADQQDKASGAGGGASGPWGPVGRSFDPEYALKGLGIAVGTAQGLLRSLLKEYGKTVSPHMREGMWIDTYHRWAAGRAERLNGLFGSASDMVTDLDKVQKVGKVLPFVGGIFSGYGQWKEDGRTGNYSTEEQAARAYYGGIAAAATDAALDWAVVGGSAAVFTVLIPVPVVGTVVGVAVGLALATGVSTLLDDQITDAGAAFGSFVYDVGKASVDLAIDVGNAAVDFGSDVLEAGEDMLGELDAVASDTWNSVRSWW
jgi:uncharacterized protein YukE